MPFSIQFPTEIKLRACTQCLCVRIALSCRSPSLISIQWALSFFSPLGNFSVCCSSLGTLGPDCNLVRPPCEVWYPLYLATRVSSGVGLAIAANRAAAEQKCRTVVIAERESFTVFGHRAWYVNAKFRSYRLGTTCNVPRLCPLN